MKHISFAFKNVFLFFIFVSPLNLVANGLSVDNLSLASQNTTDHFYMVQFDLSWENSWRLSDGPANWDAAWVFMKYLNPDNGLWMHATLNYVDGTATNDGHIEDTGCTISTPPDGKGIIANRSADGSGINNWTLQLRWNYGDDGLSDDDPVTIRIFGIEMVFVPEGAFYAGDGATGSYFQKTYINTPDASVAPVDGAGGYPNGVNQPVSDFPNGYRAFYIMKYELSEQQWVEFFNLLTLNQQLNRDITGTGGKNSDGTVNRNTIAWAGVGSEATTLSPNRATAYFNQYDCIAYLDWAALRPLSDLEFEKAARGPLPALENEYAWGTANIYDTAYTISNDGAANANVNNPTVVPTRGNASYHTTDGSINGPLRCGIFSATGNANRSHSGGSYYGVMEMSGNLFETVSPVHYSGAYTGLHGDGFLDTDGFGGAAFWPIGYYQWNIKGGCYNSALNALEISTAVNLYNWSGRDPTFTIRGARTGL